MKVAPFDLRARPAVGVRSAAASRAALPLFGSLPARWQVELPPFGSASVAVAGIDLGEAWSDAVALGAVNGLGRGRLLLPASLAARLLDTVLGGPGVFSAVRALGPAERGALVGLLGPLLDATGWLLGLGPAPAAAAGRTPAAIALFVEASFGKGPLRLELPEGAARPGADWRRRAADLPIAAQVQVASTALPASALAELAEGDAVVFDGVPFGLGQADPGSATGAAWEGRLSVGGYAAKLRIDPGGQLTLAEAFRMIGPGSNRTVVLDEQRAEDKAMEASDATENATTVLAGAPIEVVAELGRVTLRGDEVLGLGPGAVLTVAAPDRQVIVLRVGGEIWAEGELVDVEGALGVRVTRRVRL